MQRRRATTRRKYQSMQVVFKIPMTSKVSPKIDDMQAASKAMDVRVADKYGSCQPL